MKLITVLLGLLIVVGNVTDIDKIRELYREASISKENTEQFYQLTKKSVVNKNPVYSAYYGAALTLKASFEKKRKNKIDLFKKGKTLIEAAIESNPNNLELRMIRLSIQSNAPKITAYNKNIKSDKEFITANVDTISSIKLKKYLKGFMSQSKVLKNK